MKFCSACAGPLEVRIPAGDHLPRAICTLCGTIHYQNPRIICGCVPLWQQRVLLCRRAIEPRSGFWTLPAGFMENGETLQQAAARESLEEAQTHVQIESLLAVVHVLHASQVHVMFRASMLDDQFAAGAESLEVGLYEESQIPWSELAFPSVDFTLRRFFEDRRAQRQELHFGTIERALERRQP
jgi:ADP-ribose pyrophosphatase YjhB (NUDIX family)